jgi:putative phosphoesterase
MKILIFSDSHGRGDKIIRAIRLHKDAQVVFFLGDGLSELEGIAASYTNIAFLAVRGNCDAYPLFRGVPAEKTATVTLFDKKIFYTHGDLYGVKSGIGNLLSYVRAAHADIALYGHTHTPDLNYIDGVYLFNPGAVGSYEGSYGILTIDEKNVLFSHGVIK